MMKICLINTNQAWGGGEKWHYEMSKALSSQGHEVMVITHQKSELKNKLIRESINCHSFPIGKLSFLNPVIQYQIKLFLKKFAFDAVILNLPSDVKAFSKAAYLAGVQKVIYRRGMNHPIKASLLNKYFYRNFITNIIANSTEVKKSVSVFLPELEQKTTVIYNGIKIKNIQKRTDPDQSCLKIGNLGRLVEQKAQHLLIELGALLAREKIDYKILIAGEGPLKKQLEDQIERTNQKGKIILKGLCEPQDFFREIDYFILTSKFEGLSNALLEALQFRKPILCFDTASNSEIVEEGKNGYLIPPYDIDQMLKRLVNLSRNKELYEQFQINGQETLLTKFDQNQMIKNLIGLIQK